jgi:hypothetical protein
MTTFKYNGKSLVCVVQYTDVKDSMTSMTWFETFDGKIVIDTENAHYPEMYGLAMVDYINDASARECLHKFADTARLGADYVLVG